MKNLFMKFKGPSWSPEKKFKKLEELIRRKKELDEENKIQI